jgi:enamine deaminase RidA (YjgF/YER057c/UK114 family)
MNQSLPGLLEGICRSLREDVQKELTTDHARTQLAGVLDILDKLERMIVWSPDAMRERLEAMRAGAAGIEARAVAAGFSPPAGAVVEVSGAPARPLLQADLEHAMRQSDQHFAALTDWLFDDASALPPDLRSELDAQLRVTLAAALRIERRLVPRADFSSMTGAAS